MKRVMVLLAAMAILAGMSLAAERVVDVTWESVGPGGGGGHFYPSISPADPNMMGFSCDMGSIFLSFDGAKTWRTLPGEQVRRLLAPIAFHPTDLNKMYLVCFKGLMASFDKGNTWQQVIGDPKRDPHGVGYFCEEIIFDPANPDLMYVVFSIFDSKKGSLLYQSKDGGKTWAKIDSWSSSSPVGRIYIDADSPKDARVIYSADDTCVKSSADWGKTWQDLKAGLPGNKLTGFTAAWDGKGKSAFYVTLESKMEGETCVGGVYKSTDKGKTWQAINNGLYMAQKGGPVQYRHPVVTSANLDLAYVLAQGMKQWPDQSRAVWKSVDGGANWACTTFGPQDLPQCNFDPEWMTLYIHGKFGWSDAPTDIAVCETRPELAFGTNGGNACVTRDAGKRWTPMFTDKVSDIYYRGRGAEVLVCYWLYIDPKDKARRWINYSDVGLFTSKDGGSSWALAAEGSPEPNTCYEIAIDPDVPGRVYSVWSGEHGLPHWKMLRRDVAAGRGAVAVSTDYGINWEPVDEKQLPRDKGTATTIVLDPTSPKDSRTLWVGLMNSGIFKSTDGGKTWKACNNGLPQPPSRNVWRLVRHSDGTLLAGLTASFPNQKHVAGGLFVSTDGGENWKQVGADQPFDFIFGLEVDPRSSKTIYVSCFEVPPVGFFAQGSQVPWDKGNGNGGVWKTTDGGATWTKIVDKPYCWAVSINPARPDQIFVGTYVDGLLRSNDGGKTFDRLTTPPHVCTQCVTFEPGDEKTIYVSTYGGGIWKGKIKE